MGIMQTKPRHTTPKGAVIWIMAFFLFVISSGCGKSSNNRQGPARRGPPTIARETQNPHTVSTRLTEDVKSISNQGLPEQATSDDLFDLGMIPSFRIRLDPDSWRRLDRDPRSFVRVEVQVDDVIYPDVGLHLKGRRGSFRPLDAKPGFTLKFNEFKKRQRFHGLEKIHLNNSVQDPSFMTEILCSRLFRESGVPAARATNARVQLNGRNLGFYVLVEGLTADFLERSFANTQGNLYDFPYTHDITSSAVKEAKGRDPTDLRALAAAAQELNLDKRWQQLERVLDLDRFITYLALEVAIWDWDCYAMCRNNYRVYHDPTADKIVFMPHGMDQIFHNPEGSILPVMRGLVARSVLETPEGRRRYFEQMATIAEKHLTPERMTRQMAELQRRIRPVLLELNPNAARKHDQAAARLQQRVHQRIESVQQQLTHPPASPVLSSHFP
jgi:spore coat protein H